MRDRLLSPLRSLVLTAGLLAGILIVGGADRARADEPRSPGAAPESDLSDRIERILDERTTALREELSDAIGRELDRWHARMTLPGPTRAAIERSIGRLRSRPTPHGVLLDGETREVTTLRDLLDRVQSARVIYVAEQHDNPEHHAVQLRVIKAAFRANPKLLIGMEMFERPLQKHLDDYVRHRIDEPTFLERVDWKKSWGFDYNLYKPILDFAREYRLKVVALNAPRGLVRKVGREGLAALTPEERKAIAREVDVDHAAHKTQFMKALHHHGSPGGHAPDPQHYYEAMCVWDDTMAESAANHLKAPKYQGATMVVLAGAGHISYGFGIPDRVTRRIDLPSLTVIPVAVPEEEGFGEIEDSLVRPPGDFIVVTPPSPPRERR